MANPYWPLFDLSIRTPTLELRYPDDELATEVIAVAARGIHDPTTMPFGVPWTDEKPGVFERKSMQHYWKMRAEHSADEWHIGFAILRDGEPIGMQAATATNFGKTRVASTGSWLGQAFQGQGVGKEMRAAVLHFLFVGLGAHRCLSGAWHDNDRSLGVSRALGYVENGEEILMRREVADRQIRLLLAREEWEKQRRDDIEVIGLEGCIDMLIASEAKADS